MAKYQQYEEYKDSTVIWLKDLLPKTWTLSRIKYLCYVNDGNHGEEYPKESDYTDSQNGVPFIRGGNLGNYAITDEGMLYITHIKNNSMRKGRLKKGDILFVNRGEIGKLALVTEKHAGSNLNSQIAYLRVNNNKLINKYLLYYLDSSYVSNFLVSMKMGSVLTQFPIGDLLDIHVPLPLAEEQIQIANFLDFETAQIDTLIDKQQTLIQLLKEKRQAVISHAVTKGLNPDAPMKDSGVEWLGEVPEHWDVSSLKYHVDTVNGFGFSSSDVCEEGVPFIRAGNIKEKSITPTDLYLPQKVVDKYKRVILFEGDIVISMVGSDPKILKSAVGQIGVVPKSMAGAVPNQNIVILREKSDSMLKRFLFYTLCSDSYRNHLNVFSHKLANQSIISSSLIINAKFMLPSPDEQYQVVEFLDKRLVKMDEVIEKNYISLELLKERRTALISAAVTGKIDVRNWVASE